MRYLLFVLLAFNSILSSLEPVVILLGPPGAGKGTFSQHLCDHYSYHHVSAGDLVRREIDRQTPIGIEIADTVKRGEYIEKRIMFELIGQEIVRLTRQGGPFIIDGFARCDEDLAFLCELLDSLDLNRRSLVVFLEADNEQCVERIAQRMVCPQCNHVYNKRSAPPLVAGKCDACQASLKSRINDTPEVIEKRIRDYRSEIEPFVYSEVTKCFPFISFSTVKPLSACLESYGLFALQIKDFSGNVNEFSEDFHL